MTDTSKLIVKTLHGAEDILGRELAQLGATDIEIMRRAVSCQADKETLYRINYCSRLAMRVLKPLLQFQADNEKDLFQNVYDFDWHKIISPDKTIFIDHISFSNAFPNSQFVALRVKDAIVDRIRDEVGRRPYVNDENPEILLNVHATDDAITVSIDAAGAPLNRRGYRSTYLPTATNEVLAAALVELSGWTPDLALIDPMCGTGTICIEAAMKARNVPAATYRKFDFGFQHWGDFEPDLWEKVKSEANAKRTNIRLNIIGSDVDVEAIDVAKLTSLDLSLSPDVRIMRESLRRQTRTTQEGVIITCPPTNGEETKRGLDDFYKEITYFFSRNYPDHDAWLYSTELSALHAIEFKAEKKFELYNISQEGNFNLYPF